MYKFSCTLAVNASLEQDTYEFSEDANDEPVCVVLSSAAERSLIVLLNTDNGTANGKPSMLFDQCTKEMLVSKYFMRGYRYLLILATNFCFSTNGLCFSGG